MGFEFGRNSILESLSNEAMEFLSRAYTGGKIEQAFRSLNILDLDDQEEIIDYFILKKYASLARELKDAEREGGRFAVQDLLTEKGVSQREREALLRSVGF